MDIRIEIIKKYSSAPDADYSDSWILKVIDEYVATMLGNDGVGVIGIERQRQIDQEGWTPEHDDEHRNGELANAAACYALTHTTRTQNIIQAIWPFHRSWWKPALTNDREKRIRELAKAGAMIAAEIDRLKRLR